MSKWKISAAREFITALKEEYYRTNEYAGRIRQYLLKKYGEEPRPDHLAIRSISGMGFGMNEAYRFFSDLNYRYGGSYWMPSLNIASCHFEPPEPDLEKIFFSVILLEEFRYLKKTIKDYRKIKQYLQLHKTLPPEPSRMFLPNKMISGFDDKIRRVLKKPHMQEIAHVIMHGFVPNHFTFLLKDPDYCFAGYTSMKSFEEEIRRLGIPMKEKVEGDENSLLCQTSTKATMRELAILKQNGKTQKIKWPYSYVEFIKRGPDASSPTGRFEGFMPDQAQALFKMTAPK